MTRRGSSPGLRPPTCSRLVTKPPSAFRLRHSLAKAVGQIAVVLALAALLLLGVGWLGSVRQGPGSVAPLSADVLSVRRIVGSISAAQGRQAAGESAAKTLKLAAGPAADSSCLFARQDGAVVVEHRVDEPVIPASTLKLVTAVAALQALGSDFRFTTEVRSDKIPAAGRIDGDIWLLGGGDPLLSTEDYLQQQRRPQEPATRLEELADAVQRSGVKTVGGDLLVDESRYDNERIVSVWKDSYIAESQVGRLSALMLNDSQVAVSGGFAPTPEPALEAGRRLRALLRERGISVNGDVVAAGTRSGQAPTPVIGRVRSGLVSAVVAELLRTSDNTTAELLVKELGINSGGKGSTADGLEAVRAAAGAAGVLEVFTDNVVLVDGSGLAREDRVTCRLLVAALESAPLDGALIAGLPLAGRTGTLEARLTAAGVAGRVRAKTGTLAGVSALAGVAELENGRHTWFAIVVNGDLSGSAAEAAIDRVATVLVKSSTGPDLGGLGP